MRWSEDQLQAHLKAHRNRANLSKERLKTENDAKVHQANKTVLNAKIQRNKICDEKEILNCEIATVPPSVNHYWVASGKKRYLSEQAKIFHALVRVLVPAKQTEARLKLDVTFHFPNYQTRDIDNYLKAVHGDIRHLEMTGTLLHARHFVHGDIRHLESYGYVRED